MIQNAARKAPTAPQRRIRCPLVAFALVACCSGCGAVATAHIDSRGALHDEWPNFPLLARDVQFRHLTDDDFRCVFKDLKNLKVKSLALTGTEIGDRSMPLLAQVPTLDFIGLEGTRVTPEGLRQLRALPKLRRLAVSGDQFTGQAEALQRALPGVDIAIGRD